MALLKPGEWEGHCLGFPVLAGTGAVGHGLDAEITEGANMEVPADS